MKAIFYSVLCFLLISCSDEPFSIPMPAKLLKEVNELRHTGCLCGSEFLRPASTLTWNSKLADAASSHAIDMYQRKYFSHVTPEGISPKQRVENAGYQGIYRFENIAKGYNNIDQVIEAWRKSESHCRAMMHDSIDEIGIGTDHSYWVMELGEKK